MDSLDTIRATAKLARLKDDAVTEFNCTALGLNPPRSPANIRQPATALHEIRDLIERCFCQPENGIGHCTSS